MNIMVSQIDEVTRWNASMAEEAVVAVHLPAHLTDELARLIDRFHTGASPPPTQEHRTIPALGESIAFSSRLTARS